MKTITFTSTFLIKTKRIFNSILLSGLLLLVAAKELGQCTITLTSGGGTDNQTVCVNTAITNITYSTTGAKGATVNPLPAGVTGSWTGDVVTISGTPTESGTFYYTIRLKGGCGNISATGTIIVNDDYTISLTSGGGTDNQTVCVNTAITNITYSTTGAKGATVNPLPAGVTGSWTENVVTISGIPTESGTFNFTVTLIGGCGTVATTGTITVNPLPEAAGTITGTATVCQGATSVLYGVPVISNATSYTWAYSGTGATITGSTDSVTINFAANATSGNLTARGVNACGNGIISANYAITVNSKPSAITGITNVCIGSTTTLGSTPAGGTWSSGTPTVATIYSSTGLVTGVSQGTSTITYTLATGCSVSAVFNVLPSGWEIDPLDFTYHGLVTAEVFEEGSVAMQSGFLAAFVGDECRGIVESDYNESSGKYLFELTCYSDNISGDVLIFKYYNPVEDMIYNMDRSVDFASNMSVGSGSAPVKMNVGNDFTISFPVGWSWFSVNTILDNMTLKFILSAVNSNNDYIKNQVSYATYYTGYGWFGSLTVLDPTKLYKIKVQNSSGVTFSGRPVDVSLTQIPVVSGWNWVGYLSQETLPISSALSSLSLANLDYIKNQANSATYYSGYGWFGSLNSLSPYQGYMIRLSNSSTLLYPDSGKKGNQILSENEQLQFNPKDFEFSGSITAIVLVDGVAKGSASDSLYAYVNNEIRGVRSGLYFPSRQVWLFDLMIHSNISQGETVSFRYYNAENKKYYTCKETITFSADMIIANAITPFELYANATTVNDGEFINEELAIRTYPNPFEHSLNIEYYIIESTHVRITVFDTYGKAIRLLVDQKQEPGNYLIKWDSDLPSSGTYFIKLEAGHKQRIQKAFLMRNTIF